MSKGKKSFGPKKTQKVSSLTRGSKKQREEISEDEIDKFYMQKDKVTFGEVSDESEFDDYEDKFEPILELPTHDSEQSEQAEEFDSDRDILYAYDNSDQGEGNDNDGSRKWGKTKNTYYHGDTKAIAEEAAEARKIQAKKLESMKVGNFAPEEASLFFQPGKKQLLSNSTRKEVRDPVILSFSNDEDYSEDDNDRPGEGGNHSESESNSAVSNLGETDMNKALFTESALETDLIQSTGFRALDQSEKIKLLEEHSDQFGLLMRDFREKLELIEDKLKPLLRNIKSLETNEGLGFLKVKYQLLMSYCTNLAFYIGLKISGKNIKDHPVIDRMIKFRLLLEKMKPLETKLKYQIDKLLQAKPINPGRAYSDAIDPLLYKANPESLVKPDELAALSGDEATTGAYKAPKLAPMHFPDDQLKKERERNRQKQTQSQERLLRELRADLDDEPEEEAIDAVYGNTNSYINKKARQTDEATKYEEENFVRFTLTKKEKKKVKELEGKPVDELEALDDFFGELDRINTKEKQSGGAAGSLGKILGGINKKRLSNSNPSSSLTGGDDDFGRDGGGKRSKVEKRVKFTNDQSASGSEELSEIEDDMNNNSTYYDSIKAAHNNRKKSNEANNSIKQGNSTRFRGVKDLPFEDSKRPASWKMLKNRGLTPNRPKEVRNPRVNRRVKYEKAQKRLGSFKPVASKSGAGPYSGESTGIRTNITKSVRF